MRTSFIILTTLTVTAQVLLASDGFGQGNEQRKISLHFRNAPIRQVFAAIEEKADVVIAYESTAALKTENISVSVKDAKVADILDLLLRGKPLKWSIRENVIRVEAKVTLPAITGDYSNVRQPVTGIVVNHEGRQLSGASIRIKGTRNGVFSDDEGKFTIDAQIGDELIITFVGFQQKTVKISGAELGVLVMKQEETPLDAVTVSTGYWTTSKRKSTGSTTKISSREIEKQPVTSLLMALQGRVPGLDVSPVTGVAGSAVNIEIRGRNSLRNNTLDEVANSPLYVIDGIPVDPTPLRSGSSSTGVVASGYDPLASLNPAAIESIEVLKDADATAIYGSRGANGVILITTKQAFSSPLRVDVNYYAGGGHVSSKQDLLNTQEYLMMRREAFANDNAVPGATDYDLNGAWDTTRFTDWQKELIGKTATLHDLQLGVSGGNGHTSFRFGAGYHKEGTIYPGNFGFGRYTGNLSVNHRSPDQRLLINLALSYGITSSKVYEGSIVSDALQLPPHAPALYNEDGTLNWQIIQTDFGARSTFDNPLAILKNENLMNSTSLAANLNLSYRIIPGLFVKANVGHTDVNADEFVSMPIAAINPMYISSLTTATSIFGLNQRRGFIFEPQLSYEKQIGVHTFNLLAGLAWQESRMRNKITTATGYGSDLFLNSLEAAPSIFVSSDIDNKFKYGSVFLRANYDFKEKYILNLTARRDGSSRFGSGNRFGNFGAAAAAWIFSEESFMAGLSKVLSLGKLRFSYGITGNDQIGDYKFLDAYHIAEYRYQGTITVQPLTPYNPGFRWEETKKMDAGMELGLFGDKLAMEVDWYRNWSSNQLIDYLLPPSSGFQGVLRNFPATVENRGIELTLHARLIRRSDLDWNASFNIARNRNKLVAFDGLETSSYRNLYVIGEPLSIRRSFIYKGVDPQTGQRQLADLNGDGMLGLEDQHALNTFDRVFYGGFTNNLRYRAFQLSFTLQYSRQKKLGYASYYPAGYANMNMPKEVLDRWQKPGDIAAHPLFSRHHITLINQINFVGSEGNLSDASFIRVKTTSLTYTLPAAWLKKVRAGNAQLFMQGYNLFTFTGFNGLDPETGPLSLPPLRMISGGFNLQF